MIRCIRCDYPAVDLRYFWNAKIDSIEIEYHCTTLEGGCDFYRVIPLNYNPTEEEE